MVKQITDEDGVIITEQSLQLGGMASNPSGAPREPGLHPGVRERGPAAWGRARASRDDRRQASWEAAGTPGPGDRATKPPPSLSPPSRPRRRSTPRGEARAVAGRGVFLVSRGSPPCPGPPSPGRRPRAFSFGEQGAQWCAPVRPRLGRRKRHD